MSISTVYRKLVHLSSREKRMLCEGVILLFCAWLKLRVLPFRTFARGMGCMTVETPFREPLGLRGTLTDVQCTFRRIHSHFPWKPTCLVRAAAAKHMLNRRGIHCTIYLGMAKNKDSGFLDAHAWLRCGNMYITGADKVADLNAFTIVSTFGDTPHGRPAVGSRG